MLLGVNSVYDSLTLVTMLGAIKSEKGSESYEEVKIPRNSKVPVQLLKVENDSDSISLSPC